MYAAIAIITLFVQPLLYLDRRVSVMLIAAIRVVAGLTLIANVLIGRSRLLRLIADSARQSQQARTETPAVPSTPAPTERDLDELWRRITP